MRLFLPFSTRRTIKLCWDWDITLLLTGGPMPTLAIRVTRLKSVTVFLLLGKQGNLDIRKRG